MVQILHGSARTAQATRREIQTGQKGATALARWLGLYRRTVYKWCGRYFVEDLPMGPENPHFKVLSEAQEALCAPHRNRTRLPLDSCLYWLRSTIPDLSRSMLHRRFQEHEISRFPALGGDRPGKTECKGYAIGHFHIDICDVGTGEGRLQHFAAIDSTCKHVYA